MGMRRRGNRVIAAAIIAGLAVGPAWAKTNYHSGIWNLLREGGLCFAENGDSKAWPAGPLEVGGRHYEIWGYSWEETPRTKRLGTGHGNYRILVFERIEKKLSYLGNYNVDGGVPFEIQGRTVKFDYVRGRPRETHDFGDEIRFGDDGPPSQVVLDGELRSFDGPHNEICTFK